MCSTRREWYHAGCERGACLAANSTAPAQFDLVVGAEGMMSRTRRVLFSRGPTNDEYIRLEQYFVLFTMLWTPEDMKFAQWYRDSWPPSVSSI
jgi:hypothetical protein